MYKGFDHFGASIVVCFKSFLLVILFLFFFFFFGILFFSKCLHVRKRREPNDERKPQRRIRIGTSKLQSRTGKQTDSEREKYKAEPEKKTGLSRKM